MKKVFVCLALMSFFLLFAENAETIVKIESDPSGAEVFADGKPLCKATPCSKMLTVGSTIEIEMRLPNYLPLSRKEVIKENTPIKFTLQPSFAYLTVSGNYNGNIELDGQTVSFPIIEKVIEPGEHKLSLSDKCFANVKHNFTVKQGEKKKINFNPKPRKSTIKVYAQDESENDLAAEVYVDNVLIGKAPGTFEIPLCSKNLSVMSSLLEYSEELSLEEKQTKNIQAKLKRRWSNASPNKMEWKTAVEYCKYLVEDGFTDWQLPNIDELRTLVQNHHGTVSGGSCKISKFAENDERTDDCESYTYFECSKDIKKQVSQKGIELTQNQLKEKISDCEKNIQNKYKNKINFSKLGDKDTFWSSSEDNNSEKYAIDFKDGGLYSSCPGFYCGYSASYPVRCVRNTTAAYNKKTADFISNSYLQWANSRTERGSENPQAYCNKLKEGGYDDWRLPNIDELRSLIQNHPGTVIGGKCKISEKIGILQKNYQTNDCNGIDGNNFSKFVGDNAIFISSSKNEDNKHWLVDFSNGEVTTDNSTGNVVLSRCVRSKLNLKAPKSVEIEVYAKDEKGQEIDSDIFIDGNLIGRTPGKFTIPFDSKFLFIKNNNLEYYEGLFFEFEEKPIKTIHAILQKHNELQWSNRTKGEDGKMNWNDAVNYCNNLVEGGYTDWRLPNIDELRTIIVNCPQTETKGKCKVSEKNKCLSEDCWKPAGSCFCIPDMWHHMSSIFRDVDVFWSSSISSDDTLACVVNFEDANVSRGNMNSKFYVRCVR